MEINDFIELQKKLNLNTVTAALVAGVNKSQISRINNGKQRLTEQIINSFELFMMLSDSKRKEFIEKKKKAKKHLQ